MPQVFSTLAFKTAVCGSRTYTPADLETSIAHVAGHLHSLRSDVTPFVFLCADNHIKTAIAYLAIIRTGSIAVLVSPDVGQMELQEMRQQTPPFAFIRVDARTDNFCLEQEVEPCSNPTDFALQSDLGDVCTIVYTNAEDGYAKPAMLTGDNMVSVAEATLRCISVSADSRCLSLVPLSHLYGLQTGILAPLISGGSLHVERIPDLRGLSSLSRRIAQHGITHLYTTPVFYYLWAMDPEEAANLNGVWLCNCGGYKLPGIVFERFRETTGKEIHEGYGLSEAAPICSYHRANDTIRINSVGRAFDCCEISVRDERNEECRTGAVGEICIRGSNVMKGYYGFVDATNNTLKNGWLRTGDLGYLARDGFVFLTGLKKRMLNVGGKNVFPAEVERYLRAHPAVENATVFGSPSRVSGDVVHCRVRMRHGAGLTEAALRKWCRRNISRHKIPKTIATA